ncbi:hypothetical protein SLA2020_299070 [Shorea laevis]
MAAPISSIFLADLLLLLCVLPTFELRELTAESYHHTLQVSSLLPSSVCSTYGGGLDKVPSSLKVVHKHGPCSNLHQKESSAPTHAEVLFYDQDRVNSIHSRLANSGDTTKTDATTLPAYHGSTIGTENYIVKVGLGTPRTDLSLMFDTGSDITWTQCQPCVSYCYKQKEPIFDPSKSTSYLNIPCASSICRSLPANSSGCSSSTCVYAVQYGDSSYTIGFFAKERLTLTSTDVSTPYCSDAEKTTVGFLGVPPGYLGLAVTNFPSHPKQPRNTTNSSHTASRPPPAPLVTSHSAIAASPVQLNSPHHPSLTKPFMALTSSESASAAIDYPSHQPPSVKECPRTYPRADALSILDTCYDFSNYDTIRVPIISIFFSGGVEVGINISGIFFVADVSQVCLALAGNSDDSDVGIFGNVQQKTFLVVYDSVGGRVGFAGGGCH